MIAQADAIRVPLPDQSAHCCMTSPPYWGLRKYAGDQGEEPLGLESTPERHVERIVEICREVRRVLRDDGVFWLNYGDCYAGSGGENANTGLTAGKHGYRMTDDGTRSNLYRNNPRRERVAQGNLMMMPHRVALALQADGWIVRQDLVWFKRNPMPESVNGWRWQRERKRANDDPRRADAPTLGQPPQRKHDGPDLFAQPEYEYGDDLELRKGSWRHTRAHEYVFMLTKKMQYWSNQEAVRETTSENTHSRGIKRDPPIDHAGQGHDAWVSFMDRDAEIATAGRNPRSVLDVPEGSIEVFNHWLGERTGFDLNELIATFQHEMSNPDDVLDIPTAPYKGAHYATFPPNLIAPLIRATCPRWACPVCGQGWAVVVDYQANYGRREPAHAPKSEPSKVDSSEWERPINNVLGYRPTCEHPHAQEEATPGIVFDPFVGSGTTVAVAKQLLRRGIGLDISRPYLEEQAKLRTGGVPKLKLKELPLFAEMGDD